MGSFEMENEINALVTFLRNAGVAQSLLVRHVLLPLRPMCNASGYAVLQDAKSDHYSAGPSKSFGYPGGSYFCDNDDHAARTQSNGSPDKDVRNGFRLAEKKTKANLERAKWIYVNSRPAVNTKCI